MFAPQLGELKPKEQLLKALQEFNQPPETDASDPTPLPRSAIVIMHIIQNSKNLNQLDHDTWTQLAIALNNFPLNDPQIKFIHSWLLDYALTEKQPSAASLEIRLQVLLYLLSIEDYVYELAALEKPETLQRLAVQLFNLLATKKYSFNDIGVHYHTACTALEDQIQRILTPETLTAMDELPARASLTTKQKQEQKQTLFENLVNLYKAYDLEEVVLNRDNKALQKLLKLSTALKAPSESALDLLVHIAITFIERWSLEINQAKLGKYADKRASMQRRVKLDLEKEGSLAACQQLLDIISAPKVLDNILTSQYVELPTFQGKINQILHGFADLFLNAIFTATWNTDTWETGNYKTRTFSRDTLIWLFEKVDVLREQKFINTDEDGNLIIDPGTGNIPQHVLLRLNTISAAEDSEFLDILFYSMQYRSNTDTPAPLLMAITQLSNYEQSEYLLRYTLAHPDFNVLQFFHAAGEAFQHNADVKTAVNLALLFSPELTPNQLDTKSDDRTNFVKEKVHSTAAFIQLLTTRYAASMEQLSTLTPSTNELTLIDERRDKVQQLIKTLPAPERTRLYEQNPAFEGFPMVNRIRTYANKITQRRGSKTAEHKETKVLKGKDLKHAVLTSIYNKLFGVEADPNNRHILWQAYLEQHPRAGSNPNAISIDELPLLQSWLLDTIFDSSETLSRLKIKSGCKTAQAFADLNDQRFKQLFDVTEITQQQIWHKAYPTVTYEGKSALRPDTESDDNSSVATLETKDEEPTTTRQKRSSSITALFKFKNTSTAADTKAPNLS